VSYPASAVSPGAAPSTVRMRTPSKTIGEWVPNAYPALLNIWARGACTWLWEACWWGSWAQHSNGLSALRRSTPYDPYVVEAFEWVRLNSHPGDLAASAPAWRNWPLGWWLEGLGGIPTYVETDLRWIFFREEREQSSIAREIFSMADPQLAAIKAQKYGITLLVIDTRDNGRAEEWLTSGRMAANLRRVTLVEKRLSGLRSLPESSPRRDARPAIRRALKHAPSHGDLS
jgi:hypothetical protein